MIKNMLIISYEFTGHGHKSITESLCEKFAEHDDVKVHIVEVFSLGGNSLLKIAKSYSPITRTTERLRKLVWNVSSIEKAFIEFKCEGCGEVKSAGFSCKSRFCTSYRKII